MRVIVPLVVTALLTPAVPTAGQAGTGWVPALELRIVSSYPDGSRPGSFGLWTLSKGAAPFAATVWSGPSLCSIGINGVGTAQVRLSSGPDFARRTPQSANVWTLSGEYAGETAGRHAVRVTSRFERLGGQASDEATTQTLSLREGDSVTLDAMRGTVDATCQVHTVTLEARLLMQAAETSLARTQYTADLWLVRTNPAGEERREHVTTSIDGSGAVPFKFSRLAFSLTLAEPGIDRLVVFTQLSGSLRARPRPDGQIDLDLDTDPRIFTVETESQVNPPSVIRRKTITVKPDETTAVDFPVPAGFVSLPAGEKRVIRLSYDYFKGQKTQLLIRLQRPK